MNTTETRAQTAPTVTARTANTVAHHLDNTICARAWSTHDCPRQHEYEIRYAPTGYRAATVTMYVGEYAPESLIPAYLPLDDERWNGWVLPIFDRDILSAFADALRLLFPPCQFGEGLELTFDSHGAPHITDLMCPEDGDYVDSLDLAQAWPSLNDHVSIGNHALVWEEALLPL